MYHSNDTAEDEYIKYVNGLKILTRQINALKYSKEMDYGKKIISIRDAVNKTGQSKFKNIINLIKRQIHFQKIIKQQSKAIVKRENVYAPDYFSSDRIAVYTCVFGKYDSLLEPILYPDNIDYYVITDNDVRLSSGWKRKDISQYNKILCNMDNVEKNRWFKMHPFDVFPEYKYSVYIDGNIRPVSDFTEFVNRIGPCGVGMFWHRANNCVYQEALFNKYLVKKVPNETIDKQVKYLKSKGMPRNYGMTSCNIIAREHDNPICRKLMKEWWYEFYHHCKRDQLSFPYVAWKNNISMEEIAVLGNDAWNTDTLIIEDHL